MQCLYCKGKMKPGETTYNISRHGYHFVLDNAPAWICQQCGETYFEEKEVDAIQNLIKDLDKKTEKIRDLHLQPV